MASSEILKATTSFTFTNSAGTPVAVRAGETYHRDSPRLQGLSDEALEGSFDPFVPDHDFEQATAAPGERRAIKRQGDPQEPSEAAVRLAEENGIDLATVTGTGKDGRVTQPDVQAVIDSAAGSSEDAGAGVQTQGGGSATATEE